MNAEALMKIFVPVQMNVTIVKQDLAAFIEGKISPSHVQSVYSSYEREEDSDTERASRRERI